MTDRNDHVSAHPVTRQTGYTELHDAFVDDVNNKGLSDQKAVHYEKDANGAYLYISDKKAKAEAAQGGNKAQRLWAKQVAEEEAARDQRRAARVLRRSLRHEFPNMPLPPENHFSESDLRAINGSIRDYYAAAADDLRVPVAERRLHRAAAEIYGYHATKEGSKAKLINPRGRAAGLVRLENAVRDTFLAHPNRMRGQRRGNIEQFAAQYAAQFVKGALGDKRLDGLTPANLEKIKTALSNEGIDNTPAVNAFGGFLGAQSRYNRSSRGLICGRIANLRQLAANGALDVAVGDAQRLGWQGADEQIQFGLRGAVQRTETAIKVLDSYMGRAQGFAGIKDGERVLARHLLRDAADFLATATAAMPDTVAGNAHLAQMQELYAAVIDLNQSLATRDERKDLAKEQAVLPPRLLGHPVDLKWGKVLDKRMRAPKTLTDFSKRGDRNRVGPGTVQERKEVHQILWGKPGSGNATAAADFAQARARYNDSLVNLTQAYNTYRAPSDNLGDGPRSNENLEALRGDLNTALEANAVMLEQLRKASSRHDHEAVRRNHQDILRANDSASWFTRLFRSCCPWCCGPGAADDVDLPAAHDRRIRRSRNLINKMTLRAEAQRAALLALSRDRTITELQRRTFARNLDGHKPYLNTEHLNNDVDYHGHRLLQDYGHSRWARKNEARDVLGNLPPNAQVGPGAAVPEKPKLGHPHGRQNDSTSKVFDPPNSWRADRNDPHIVGIGDNEADDKVGPLLKDRVSGRSQRNRAASNFDSRRSSLPQMSDANSNEPRSRTQTRGSIWDEETHQASLRRDSRSVSIDDDNYSDADSRVKPPQPQQPARPSLHRNVASATTYDSLYLDGVDYNNAAYKHEGNPDNKPSFPKLHRAASSRSFGSIYNSPEQYINPAVKNDGDNDDNNARPKSRADKDFEYVFGAEGHQTGTTGVENVPQYFYDDEQDDPEVVSDNETDAGYDNMEPDDFEVGSDNETSAGPEPSVKPGKISVVPDIENDGNDNDDPDDFDIQVLDETQPKHPAKSPIDSSVMSSVRSPSASGAQRSPFPEFPDIYRFGNAPPIKPDNKNVSFSSLHDVHQRGVDQQGGGAGNRSVKPKLKKAVSFNTDVYYDRSSSDDDEVSARHLKKNQVDPKENDGSQKAKASNPFRRVDPRRRPSQELEDDFRFGPFQPPQPVQHHPAADAVDNDDQDESDGLSLGGDASSDDALSAELQKFLDSPTDSEDDNDANEKGPAIESTITTHADGNSKSKT